MVDYVVTPLNPGDVIWPSEKVLNQIDLVMKHKTPKPNLRRGLITEYSHNETFSYHCMGLTLTSTADAYDRQLTEFPADYQDDKLSLHTKTGELSSTHTISKKEYEFWCGVHRAGGDVIIHSFVEDEPGSTGSMYVASLSFRLVREAGILYPSLVKDGTWYFDREMAYQVGTIQPKS